MLRYVKYPNIKIGINERNFIFYSSKFIIWIFCIISGFCYVNYFSLNRPYLFKSRHLRYNDFIYIFIFSIFCFFTAAMTTIKGFNNDEIKIIKKLYSTYFYNFSNSISRNYSGITLDINIYIINKEISNNEYYSVIFHNLIYFCLPYVFLLHFTYMEHIPLFNEIRFTPKHVSNWKKIHWLLFLFFIFNVGYIIYFHLYVYFNSDANKFYLYLFLFGIEVLGIPAITYTFRRKYFLHVHHYFVGCLIIPFLNYRHEFTTFYLGVFTAIMVEGAARWGVDPVWNIRNNKQSAIVTEKSN